VNGGGLGALLRLELRRGLEPNRRLIGLFAAGTALMAVLGWMSPNRFAWFLALVATTFFMQVPMGVLRDKLDGGLEFLVSLPATTDSLALGRLLAAAIACIPCAIGLAVAARLWFPTEVDALPGGLFAGAALAWIATALACVLMVAVAFRFEARTTLYVPISLGLVGIALDEIAPGLIPHPLVVAGWLTRRTWSSGVLWAVGIVAVMLLTWLAFWLARSGIERFEPGRDRISW
jgi:hypothetical protein